MPFVHQIIIIDDFDNLLGPARGGEKVNLITVTRRALMHHPNIAAGLYCFGPLHRGFSPYSLQEVKWVPFQFLRAQGIFSPIHGTDGLKSPSERLGNEDKAPCPRALLPGPGARTGGPPVWKSEALNRSAHDSSSIFVHMLKKISLFTSITPRLQQKRSFYCHTFT